MLVKDLSRNEEGHQQLFERRAADGGLMSNLTVSALHHNYVSSRRRPVRVGTGNCSNVATGSNSRQLATLGSNSSP